MSVFDVEIDGLRGGPADLGQYRGKAVLIVNVASKCGLTPQYSGLERLQERYAERGFTVLGVPCNQFMGQEPGTADEIAEFCSATYGVTFPMTEKVEVNGDGRHPLYRDLVGTPDAEGHTATSAGTSRSSWSPPTARSRRASRPRPSPRRPRSSPPSRRTSRPENRRALPREGASGGV